MRFSKENQSGIFQRYIEFKIKHGEIGKALLLNYTNKFSTWNLFRKIDRVKNGMRIKELIKKIQSDGERCSGVESFLSYDQNQI